MRLGTITLIAALTIPTVSTTVDAQSASRGIIAGPQSGAVTIGPRQGPLPAGATTGGLRGPLPAGATVGIIAAPGVGDVRPGLVGIRAGSVPSALIRGPLPTDATAGTVALPFPSGSRLGELTPLDVANRLDQMMDIYATDHVFDHAQQAAGRATAIREDTLGPDSPAVAESLDRNAGLLRLMGQDAQAAPYEAQADKIRRKQE